LSLRWHEDAPDEDPPEWDASGAEFDELGPLDEIEHENACSRCRWGARCVRSPPTCTPWWTTRRGTANRRANRAACAEIALRMGMGRDAQTPPHR